MSTLSNYIERLGCADEAERIYAAEDIGYLNDANGVSPLIERLAKESSAAVRDVIFQALIRIDADLAIESSIRLFGNEDPQIRNQAVEVLRHKDGRSIPFLGKVMQNGDKHARKLVLDALKGKVESETSDIYALALADEDLNVVITAVENLGEIVPEQFRSKIEGLLKADSHPMLIIACVEALVKFGHTSSLAAIHQCLPDPAILPDFCLLAYLNAMGALGEDVEFFRVAGLLSKCAPRLGAPVLNALIAMHPRCHRLGVDSAFLSILRTLIESDAQPLRRYQATRVLGFWSNQEETYEFLVFCLFNEERLVRLGAAESLRITHHPDLNRILAARAREETDADVLKVLQC